MEANFKETLKSCDLLAFFTDVCDIMNEQMKNNACSELEFVTKFNFWKVKSHEKRYNSLLE